VAAPSPHNSRTLLDALADLRTARPIYLAALNVVEELQFTDHPTARKFVPSGRFVPAVTLEALRDARLCQSGNCPVPDVNRVRDVRSGSRCEVSRRANLSAPSQTADMA